MLSRGIKIKKKITRLKLNLRLKKNSGIKRVKQQKKRL